MDLTMEASLPISAVVDGTAVAHSDSLYLLDDAGTVLSYRGERSQPSRGTCFWAELGTTRAELAALCRTLEKRETEPYLMQCGPVPVLVLRYPFYSAPYLLAVVPRGEVAQALRTPAAYEGYLYRELKLSPHSLARKMPYDQEMCDRIRDWLHPYMCVFLREGKRREEASTLMQILMMRTFRLAKLCGVKAAYDFGGIGFGEIDGIDYKLLAAQQSALMLLAARAAKGRATSICVERDSNGVPVIYARMLLEDSQDALPELARLREVAISRGAIFKTEIHAAQEGVLHIRFSFCTPEISLQRLRNPFTIE